MPKEYQKKAFPWTSKSKLGDLDYCEYNFFRTRVQTEERRDRKEAIEGTNMHVVFAAFYQALSQQFNKDSSKLFADDLTDPRIPVHRHPFRKVIYEGCMKFVKPEQRDYDKYKNILRNFATIECRRWLRLNTLLHNQAEIFDYFKPLAIEKYLEYEPLHLYGTIDRINKEVMPDGSRKIAIYDYKTGNVPKAIKDHIDTGEMFDWKLPAHYMKEIHFYGLLYLLCVGWNVGEEVTDFLENDNWWYTKSTTEDRKEVLKAKGKYLTDLGKKYKIFKEGRLLKKGDLIVGFYFLNGDDGYKPIKEYGYPSHKSVIQSINNYRSVRHSKDYITHPIYTYNQWGCEARNCHRLNECRELISKVG